MLQRVGETVDPQDAVVKIKDASFPAPFASELEYNSPVHGNWNIVHTGMLVPEAIQIYVCADNCMRGVVLTAAEMNAADRFSFVIVEEQHVLNGNLEDITIAVSYTHLDVYKRQHLRIPEYRRLPEAESENTVCHMLCVKRNEAVLAICMPPVQNDLRTSLRLLRGKRPSDRTSCIQNG